MEISLREHPIRGITIVPHILCVVITLPITSSLTLDEQGTSLDEENTHSTQGIHLPCIPDHSHWTHWRRQRKLEITAEIVHVIGVSM